ncbi:MAG TPA: TonB family protein [Candidatus Solibacter sp.]|nr:TonB family protein [Candidatus Solibacter sp.]
MRDPLLRPFSWGKFGDEEGTESWLNRVRENLGQLLLVPHFKPSSANGAPIHLLKFDKSTRPARAQGASLVTHAAIFAGLVFLLARGPGSAQPRIHPGPSQDGPIKFTMPVFRSVTNEHASSGMGQGGDLDPLPATHGNVPPLSSLVLVKPTLPRDQHPNLPEPPTIFDSKTPPVLAPTNGIGLPWMANDTNSGGPGKGHGIGSKDGDNLGDRGLGPAGYGSANNPYTPGMIAPGCAYCPYPTYTDDARHAKVQGAVTLEVLVGEDGRAHAIRIVKGIGFGLDERAVETVRGWKFTPARDGAQRPVEAWVTVEAVFRLF